MSKYSIFNPESNQELTYGYEEEIGYFYDIIDHSQKSGSDSYFIVERKFSNLDLLPEELEGILDEWDAPREHMLAVILGQQF